LKPFVSEVSACLSSGQIPVMVYENDVLVVRSAAEGPYVAVSHVWVDGLGSSTEQGLPTCQVSRIAAHARQLVPSGIFWVDSLCVPSEMDLRKRAIRLMAETYERADKVIVLDTSIRTFCSLNTPLTDILVRMTVSPWIHRVWTLQEALLGGELYFEFSDGLFPFVRLRKAWMNLRVLTSSPFGLIHCNFPRMHLFTVRIMRFFNRRSNVLSFPDLVDMLHRRTTSHPEDETVAIAGLLGVNVNKLLIEHSGDARMRAFLLELKTLPADILLTGVIPRLAFDCFRWAPRTLTSIGPLPLRSTMGRAQCTTQGLTTE
ncbi:hypothetical protein C8Q80DRAFT_1066184, partial [Daedaleopsis nitida]